MCAYFAEVAHPGPCDLDLWPSPPTLTGSVELARASSSFSCDHLVCGHMTRSESRFPNRASFRTRVRDTCPGHMSGTRVRDTCPGHVSGTRVRDTCPGHVSRTRVWDMCPRLVQETSPGHVSGRRLLENPSSLPPFLFCGGAPPHPNSYFYGGSHPHTDKVRYGPHLLGYHPPHTTPDKEGVDH